MDGWTDGRTRGRRHDYNVWQLPALVRRVMSMHIWRLQQPMQTDCCPAWNGVGRQVLRGRSLKPRQKQPLTLPPLPGRPECESRLSRFSSCKASSASWATRSSEAEGPPGLRSVQRKGSARQQPSLHSILTPTGHLVSLEPSEPKHPELTPRRLSPALRLGPAAGYQTQDTQTSHSGLLDAQPRSLCEQTPICPPMFLSLCTQS